METKKAKIYIDGAARGNPGAAGIGVFIEGAQGEELRSFYKYIGETTNNVAEYTALIYGLQEALILGLKQVLIHSDSELLIKQLAGEYRVRHVNLKPYYEQFLHLQTGFDKLEMKQIGREENKQADKLANQAIDSRIDTNLKAA